MYLSQSVLQLHLYKSTFRRNFTYSEKEVGHLLDLFLFIIA